MATGSSGLGEIYWIFFGRTMFREFVTYYVKLLDENGDKITSTLPAFTNLGYHGTTMINEMLLVADSPRIVAGPSGLYIGNLPACTIGGMKIYLSQNPYEYTVLSVMFDSPYVVGDYGLFGFPEGGFYVEIDGIPGCRVSSYAINEILECYTTPRDSETPNLVVAGLNERWIGLLDELGMEIATPRLNFLSCLFQSNLSNAHPLYFGAIDVGTTVAGWVIFDGENDVDNEIIRGDFFSPMTVTDPAQSVSIAAGDFVMSTFTEVL